MKSKPTKIQCEPEGNTNTSSSPTHKTSSTQCYRWQFTLKANMGEPHDPDTIIPMTIYENLVPYCKEFYYQLEEGKDGYKHYQGCFSLNQKHRMQEVKNIIGWNDVHLERAMNWYALKNYSTKKETRVWGPWSHKSTWIRTIDEINFYEWQRIVYNILKGPDEDRKIWWFWEAKGNAGKTAFCKWCCVHLGATILRGGALKDIAHSLPDNPKIVIFDFPRTCEDRVNYDALEQVKDGLVFSAKYESKMKVFNPPIVVCFANFEPEKENMSLDRWEVYNLNNMIMV